MSLNELKDYLFDLMVWARMIQDNFTMGTPLSDLGSALWIEVEMMLLWLIAFAICAAPFGAVYWLYDGWKTEQARGVRPSRPSDPLTPFHGDCHAPLPLRRAAPRLCRPGALHPGRRNDQPGVRPRDRPADLVRPRRPGPAADDHRRLLARRWLVPAPARRPLTPCHGEPDDPHARLQLVPDPTPSFFEHGGSRSVNEIREHLTWIGDCMMAAPLEHTYAMWLLPAAPLVLPADPGILRRLPDH